MASQEQNSSETAAEDQVTTVDYVDMLHGVPAEVLAKAFGTDQILPLADIDYRIGGLREASKSAWELANLLVQGAAVKLTKSDLDTEHRVASLVRFVMLSKLKLSNDEDDPAPPRQLTIFASIWSVSSQAHLKMLVLSTWEISEDISSALAKAFPELKDITLIDCRLDGGAALLPLASCSQLQAVSIVHDIHVIGWFEPESTMAAIKGLAQVSSLRSLDFSLPAWKDCSLEALCNITQLERLRLASGPKLRNLECQDMSRLVNLQELILDCFVPIRRDLPGLPEALPAMQQLKRVEVQTLTPKMWNALCQTPVEEVVLDGFANLRTRPLPLEHSSTISRVQMFKSSDNITTSVVAVGAILKAVSSTTILHLPPGDKPGLAFAPIEEHLSGDNTEQALAIAGHLPAVIEAGNSGRLVGAAGDAWRPTVWLIGDLAVDELPSWQPLPGIATLLMTGIGMSTPLSYDIGLELARIFPDLSCLQVQQCRGDTSGFVHAFSSTQMPRQVVVHDCLPA